MSRIPAVTRALDILSALATGPTSARALSRDLDIPRSTTYQLLDVLESRGFVRYVPRDRRWMLGLTAFEVGSAYPRRDPWERIAAPLLRTLAASAPVPVVVHLGELHGHEIVYVIKEQSDRMLTTVTEVGVRLPAALTASGRAILAQLPRAQVRAQMAVRGAFVDRTGRGPRSLSALTALVARERRQGFAEEDGFVTDGYTSVAVAVKDGSASVVAALSITFRSADASPHLRRRLVQAALKCAEDLKQRL